MRNQIVLTSQHCVFAPARGSIPSALGAPTQIDCRLTTDGAGGHTSHPWRLLAFGAFTFAAVLLALPSLVSAQTLVPLISLSTNKPTGAAARTMSSAAMELDGASVVYVDSSQITYPSVLPAQTIAGPASPDVQVNDPSLDHILVFSKSDTYGFNSPDWEYCTQSETTLAADGTSNIVVSYNSTADIHQVKVQNAGYFPDVLLPSAYSVSHDGGQTWRSGFIAPSSAVGATGGDGVVAADRAGNFYYASLGALLGPDEVLHRGVLVGKSTDHGDTFAPAQFVAVDPGSDKEWITVGPDPAVPSRDNVYVTWQSFTNGGASSAIVFSRSTDGGATWSPAKTLFAYSDDGVLSSIVLQSNPTVDKSNGRLYVPFVHLDHINGDTPLFGGPDYERVLVSDDGGNTFTPLAFNVPGTPNPFLYPVLQVGTPADCGVQGGTRTVIKQGPDIGGGFYGELYGLPRFVHCTRTIEQPATAAQNGRVIIAFNNSIADVATNPSSPSEIIALYSKDAGQTWFPPFVVAPATTADPQHFHPAVALAPDGNTLYVAYYVQQSNEQVRTEMATLQVTGRGLQLQGRQPLSSVAFDLEPNNVPSPIPPLKADNTLNFDNSTVAGYALGEYMGVAIDAAGKPLAAWGDSRNSWVSPADGYYPGTHPQTDVFFVRP